jgi:outer membrane protein assembly factor BamB
VTPGGRELWRLRLAGLVSSAAVTADGSVVVGDSTGQLAGLRPSGAGPGELWRVDLGEQSYGSPVWSPDGRTVYQSVVSGVVAVRDGDILWRSAAPEEMVEVSPAVAPDGTIVVGTNDPWQYGLNPGDGSVRWRYRRDFWTYSSPGVTRDGVSYFGDHANRITGLDAATGKRVFGFQGSRRNTRVGGVGIWTSVLVDARHAVYAGTRQGLIYGVDRDGRLMWQFDAGVTVDSYPALTGERICAHSPDGLISAHWAGEREPVTARRRTGGRDG